MTGSYSHRANHRKAPFIVLHVAAAAIAVVAWRGETAEAALVNVALRKPSAQVDDLHDRAESHLGNDGDSNQSLQAGACTHTRTSSHVWWLVDLIHSYDVFNIRILNRNSDIARLSDFYIYVSSDDPSPISSTHLMGNMCLQHPGTVSPNGYQELRCDKPIRGRYVYIWRQKDLGPLTLCDFQVMVDLTSRQMSCPIQQGVKMFLTPVYSEILDVVSFTNCLLVCAASPERDSNFIQINKHAGRCECLQSSPLGPNFSALMNPHVAFCSLKETNASNK